MTMLRRIGIAVLGLGWMGQAHSRSVLRIPSLFPDRSFDPRLVVCADTAPECRERSVRDFGFERAVEDWREAVAAPDVDAVWVTAPNMLHVPMIEAACAAGKAVFSEKPIGGKPGQAVQALHAAQAAGVATGVGYNYLWAPLVLHAHYRGRFLSMYGSDELGLLTWRFMFDQAGYGVTSDVLSHSVSLAHFLVGGISEVVGMKATTITHRPLPTASAGHYGRGRPEDAQGAVENEDFASMLCRFSSGATGTFECSRTLVGPESQNARSTAPRERCPGTWSGSTSCRCIGRVRESTVVTPPSSAVTGSRSTGCSSRARPTRSDSRTWWRSRTTRSSRA
jgi:predicted dehydrogenase